jgi:hypothetical protein
MKPLTKIEKARNVLIEFGVPKEYIEDLEKEQAQEFEKMINELKDYFWNTKVKDLECNYCDNTIFCNFFHRTDVVERIEQLKKEITGGDGE